MTDTSTYDRALRIAKSIQRMIEEDGGTSSHVSTVVVRLPASTFDQIRSEGNPIRGESDRFIIWCGITFERGDEDATIIENNMARGGRPPKIIGGRPPKINLAGADR